MKNDCEDDRFCEKYRFVLLDDGTRLMSVRVYLA